jgi:hypothetical protein
MRKGSQDFPGETFPALNEKGAREYVEWKQGS